MLVDHRNLEFQTMIFVQNPMECNRKQERLEVYRLELENGVFENACRRNYW